VNKVLVMVGVLALGALGLAFVLRNQSSNAKTVTLEPNKVVKTLKSKAKNSSAKSAGSLEDLTKNAPEPRAVTTDAIVVPSKPAPSVSSAPEVFSPAPKVTSAPKAASQTPVASTPAPTQTAKPAPEITKPIEQPQVSSTLEPTTSQPSSVAVEKPVVPETTPSVPAPTLPLRRLEGSVSIQAGAFKNADNAEALRVQLTSQGFQTSVELGADGISRVIVGPYPNEEAARDAMSKISSR
jgi:cell division protein FtsN